MNTVASVQTDSKKEDMLVLLSLNYSLVLKQLTAEWHMLPRLSQKAPFLFLTLHGIVVCAPLVFHIR